MYKSILFACFMLIVCFALRAVCCALTLLICAVFSVIYLLYVDDSV